jgi:hypothetical protein
MVAQISLPRPETTRVHTLGPMFKAILVVAALAASAYAACSGTGEFSAVVMIPCRYRWCGVALCAWRNVTMVRLAMLNPFRVCGAELVGCGSSLASCITANPASICSCRCVAVLRSRRSGGCVG